MTNPNQGAYGTHQRLLPLGQHGVDLGLVAQQRRLVEPLVQVGGALGVRMKGGGWAEAGQAGVGSTGGGARAHATELRRGEATTGNEGMGRGSGGKRRVAQARGCTRAACDFGLAL